MTFAYGCAAVTELTDTSAMVATVSKTNPLPSFIPLQ
jgi:hypothetical protein